MFNIFVNFWDKIVEIGAKAFVATGVVAITVSPTPIIKETPKEPVIEEIVLEEVVDEEVIEEKKEEPKVVEKIIYKTVEVPVIETPVVEETPKEEVKEELPLVNPNQNIFTPIEVEESPSEDPVIELARQQEEANRIAKAQIQYDAEYDNIYRLYNEKKWELKNKIADGNWDIDRAIVVIKEQNKSDFKGRIFNFTKIRIENDLAEARSQVSVFEKDLEQTEFQWQIDLKKLKDKYPDLF